MKKGMKKFEKLLAFTLVFCMAFASSANVFATETMSLAGNIAEAGGSMPSAASSDATADLEPYQEAGGEEDDFSNHIEEEPVGLAGNSMEENGANQLYNVTITTGSAEREYNGKPLTCEEYSVEGLPEGCKVESIEFAAGSDFDFVEVGRIENTAYNAKIVDASGTDITDNCNITYIPGQLKISENTAEIKIVSKNGSWAYDGEEHNEGYYVSYKKDGKEDFVELNSGETCLLPTGDEIYAETTSVTDVTGNDGIKNQFTELNFLNQDQYANVTISNGTLYVSKRYITITADKTNAVYDGEEKGSSGEFTVTSTLQGGLPAGQKVSELKIDGTASAVGLYEGCLIPSDAKIVDENGKDTTANYNITYAAGDLNIYMGGLEDYVTLTPTDVSVVYDGSAHAAGTAAAIDKLGHTLTIEYSADGVHWTEDPSEITATTVADSKTVQIRVSSPAYEGYKYGSEKLEVKKANISDHVKLKVANVQATYDGSAHAAGNATAEDDLGNSVKIEYSGDKGLTWIEDPSSITITDANDWNNVVMVRASADNYSGYVYKNEKLVVLPKNISASKVTLTPADVSCEYDGNGHAAGAATANDPLGNSLKIEYSLDGQNWTTDPTTITAKDVYDSSQISVRVSCAKNTYGYQNYYGYKTAKQSLEITETDIAKYASLSTNDVSLVYDGSVHTAGSAQVDDPFGNPFEIEYSADGVHWTEDPAEITAKDVADSKTVQIKAYATNVNYTGVLSGSAKLEITPADIQDYVRLTPADVSCEYDGNEHAAGAATANDPLGNSLKIEYSLDNQNWTTDPTTITAKDVYDSSQISVRVSCAKNTYGYQNYYGYKTAKQSLEITETDIAKYASLSTNDVSLVYDGSVHTAGSAQVDDPFGNPFEIEYSADGVHWTEDPAEITAKDVADSKTVQIKAYATNVNYTGVLSGSAKLEITPADVADYVSLTATDVSLEYDGSAHAAGTAVAEDKLGNPLTVEYSVDGENWTRDPAEITATNPEDSKTIQLRVSGENYSGYVTGTEKLTILASEKKDDQNKDQDPGKDVDKDSGHKGNADQKTDGKGDKTKPAANANTDAKSNVNAAADKKADTANTVSSKSDAVSTGDSLEVLLFTALAVFAGAAVLLLVRRKRHA